MWVRSKYEKYNEDNDCLDNNPVNVDFVKYIDIENPKIGGEGKYRVAFVLESGDYGSWIYETKEERDGEYEWILSRINCSVNT